MVGLYFYLYLIHFLSILNDFQCREIGFKCFEKRLEDILVDFSVFFLFYACHLETFVSFDL